MAGLNAPCYDRIIQGRAKFTEAMAHTRLPQFLRELETEVFRPEHTDSIKIECLRRLVTGVHAEKLAKAIEEDCVRFAQEHPVVELSVGFLTPVKGFTLEASSAYEPLYRISRHW